MRFVTPYHKGVRIQRGRGEIRPKGFQYGSGLGGLLKTVWRYLAPLAKKGLRAVTNWIAPAAKAGISKVGELGKAALQNPDIKAAVTELGNSALEKGINVVNNALNPDASKPKGATKRKDPSTSSAPSKKAKKATKPKGEAKKKTGGKNKKSVKGNKAKNKKKSENSLLK
jgi:hypothetical protein